MHDPRDTLPARYLNPRQAAEYIGVTPRCLEAWRHRGGGPPYSRIGRLVRFDVQQLDEWMVSHRRTSTSDFGRSEAR